MLWLKVCVRLELDVLVVVRETLGVDERLEVVVMLVVMLCVCVCAWDEVGVEVSDNVCDKLDV